MRAPRYLPPARGSNSRWRPRASRPEESDRETARGSTDAGALSTPASREERGTAARAEQERELRTSREADRETERGTALARPTAA